MGDFVKVDFRNGTQVVKMRCGCAFDENGSLLNRCAGHPDRTSLQKGKRCEVLPLKKENLLGKWWRRVTR